MLPHWQLGGSVYLSTFRSARGALPEIALNQVLVHIRHDCGRRYDLHLAVAMPDHVHLIIQPRERTAGEWFDLAEIFKGIKGSSARRINLLLGTSGQVWQQETFDRLIRDAAEFDEKMTYMWNNPVKAGLVNSAEDWPYFVFKGETMNRGL